MREDLAIDLVSSAKLRDRFFVKVAPPDERGCRLWLAGFDDKGYGLFRLTSTRIERASRIAWRFAYGDIPNRLIVCHHCDVRACVEPTHLFLGTRADNNADRDRKGRHIPLRGASHGRAKLTPKQIAKIRATGKPLQPLADKYGVNITTISRILLGKSWRCVQ